MEQSEENQTTILLHLYERQNNEIERREGREQHLFEWTAGLLVAALGGVIALAEHVEHLPHRNLIKLLTSVMLAVPTLIFVERGRRYSRGTVENAKALDRIEELLHLFDPDYFGARTPYPSDWKGGRVATRLRRRTPLYYLFILLVMAACVITTAWLIL
jgi:hypothetical protein